MKHHGILRTLLAAAALAILTLATGCTVTPHVNMGVGLDYYNGGFHLRPHANVGVYGRP